MQEICPNYLLEDSWCSSWRAERGRGRGRQSSPGILSLIKQRRQSVSERLQREGECDPSLFTDLILPLVEHCNYPLGRRDKHRRKTECQGVGSETKSRRLAESLWRAAQA